MTARYVVRISPSDVGRRVSVRFRIPGGPGQPSASDAVGTLRSWEGGQLSVERRDGTLTLLDERDLLAGRVIGPPPHRRSERG